MENSNKEEKCMYGNCHIPVIWKKSKIQPSFSLPHSLPWWEHFQITQNAEQIFNLFAPKLGPENIGKDVSFGVHGGFLGFYFF